MEVGREYHFSFPFINDPRHTDQHSPKLLALDSRCCLAQLLPPLLGVVGCRVLDFPAVLPINPNRQGRHTGLGNSQLNGDEPHLRAIELNDPTWPANRPGSIAMSAPVLLIEW